MIMQYFAIKSLFGGRASNDINLFSLHPILEKEDKSGTRFYCLLLNS